jgi:enoyl-CoA hydratase/carnithine racemase
MAGLNTHRVGSIGWIILSNVARKNAITYDMWRGLPEAVATFERDSAVRVIGLSGEGERAFSSGADVYEFDHARDSGGATASYNEAVDDSLSALLNASKPTVSRIRGACVGGGMGIAAHTDLRYCSEDAVFAQPAARIGLGLSHPAIWRVSDLIGQAHCAEMIFTGWRITAPEALQMRFVNRVVPGGELDAVVNELCESIAANAPLTIAAAKRSLLERMKDPAKRDLRAVQAMIDACFSSEDYREGRAAFRQKRVGVFRGR